MTQIVGVGGGDHGICVTITHYARKSICDSPIYLNTIATIEKMEPRNYD